MKRIIILAGCSIALLVNNANGQNNKVHHKATFKEPQPGYYQKTILKGLDDAEKKHNAPEPVKIFKADLEGLSFPTNPEDYTQAWHNKPISQGQTGTCWCFSTTSFYESEVQRITGQKIKLSEMYTVYWEYVERAKYFVENRGKMNFGEGSETNAVARMIKIYGMVPAEAFSGKNPEIPFHNHTPMFKELDNYLKGVKERNAWNKEEVVATTKSILNYYLGTPPKTVKVNNKEMTPQEYTEKVLKLKTDDYVNFMSLMQAPYYQKSEYKVEDNWWKSNDYNNVPLEDFMEGIKSALKKGYTISIGGDVSEAGLDANKQVAIIPTFDIPSEYIDENARQFRFSNKTTTDDHAMHLVGYLEKDGKTWFLIKDSGAGSRNCGESCKSFGYFFFHEDYIKLKMMTTTVHKDAVKDMLKKIKV